MSVYLTEQQDNLDIIHLYRHRNKKITCVMSKHAKYDIKEMMGLDMNRYIPYVMSKIVALVSDECDNYELIFNIDKYGTITPCLNGKE